MLVEYVLIDEKEKKLELNMNNIKDIIATVKKI